MKNSISILVFSLLTWSLSSQVIFQEDFEANMLPAGWTIETLASDGGWVTGNTTTLSSQAFGIQSNGSNFFIGTNDDRCNCNKSNDLLITPAIDLSGNTNAVLSFDLYYWNRVYGGIPEAATVEISIDGGTNWTLLQNFDGNPSWNKRTIDISAYAGNNNVLIGFRYTDGGGWLYGCVVDNVTIFVPNTLDAQLLSFDLKEFAEQGDQIPISFNVFNNGVETINTLEVSYSVDGNEVDTEQFNGLTIEGFKDQTLSFTNDWVSSNQGNNSLELKIVSVNGQQDEDDSNNMLSADIEIYEKVEVPNKIDEFLAGGSPLITTVADAGHGLNRPTDLDFYPILALNELWVINQRSEGIGGSTTTLYDAGKPEQTHWTRVDGNSWHFMSLPTGIAFSENGNFANSPGVQDANHSGGTFTGPSLWDSDPAVYAQPSGGNGSHIDMLHGSPMSMGIAADKDNAFWLYDSWNGMPVYYDFVEDHGPGNDDHADGIVRRYSEISLVRDGDVPSHMVLDSDKKWLYIVDNGNDRVLRMDITTGVVSSPLNLINELLAEHSQMGSVTYETIINLGLDRPSGIEIIENRLLVGDYSTGHIVVYDIDNDFAELGRIIVGQEGLTGIKIGPEGNIWCTNRSLNLLQKLEPQEATRVNDPELIASLNMYPNPASEFLNIELDHPGIETNASFQIHDVTGKSIYTSTLTNGRAQVMVDDLANGIYIFKLRSGDELLTKEFVVIHK